MLPIALAAAASALAVAQVFASAPVDEQALAARCGRGFAIECRELGRARLAGESVPRDDRLAAAHIMQACEMGDPAACGDLGVLYAIGRGLPQSDDRAAALSRRACEQGAGIACSNRGALAAEGVGAPAAASAEPDAPVIRLLRRACDAGVPEGCANLGTAYCGGKLAVRDVEAAARAYRRACDVGFALACHRLALLLHDRPGVAPDLTATALATRACRAGIAPACYAVSAQPPPPSARTPAARLVDDPHSLVLGIPGMGGFSAGELTSRRGPARPKRVLADLRRPLESVRAAVPEELRTPLGVDAPPAAGSGGDAAVELLLALRRPLLGQCYETPRAHAETRTEAFAVLFLDGDGRPADVRVRSVPRDPTLEGCVRELVEAWEFPASDEGWSGPFLVRRAFDPSPGPPAEYLPPDGLRPALREAGCVRRALHVPAQYRGSTGAITVKLTVDAGGKPGLVYPLTPVPDAVADAVAAAVRSCAWNAGGDAEGRPIPLWTTLTLALEGR